MVCLLFLFLIFLMQKRKMATNVCLISFPMILCTLLILFQVIINKALNEVTVIEQNGEDGTESSSTEIIKMFI
mgnify:CR=1 FL=1